ncbi:hypothetical protein GCM10011348_20650 [Marinobacterium nitratireducens]|uniref:Lysozyme inhibitor LprI-like N-terminal domain-containing protein n=1 Tax=Marinobacterium nitratireducens TaxID=518897 RepID=A0A917ZEF6_9GAMM|nr:lysozyme inhibitor LprI family protein [Marinobacterium nitratireducens]GGO81490.1 hypothetical protein GCM10011348_20650 [Marinobacterium nitratireducens]
MNRILPLIFALAAASASLADESHPLDRRLDDCLSLEENASTAGMLDCIDDAARRWDTELNNNYRRLLSQLTPSRQERLRASQRAWLQYRDRERDAADAIYGGLEGTMYLPMHAMRVLRITSTRALELDDYLSLLQGR